MDNMTPKHKNALILSTVVSLTGFVVMTVYIFGFVSQRDTAVSMAQNVMSFSSAICFFLSGVAFYYIARVMEGEIAAAQMVLPVASLVISVFIAVHAVSMALGDPHAGMRQSLGVESYDMLDQMVLMHPSLASMVNFVLVAIAGVLAMVCAPCRAGTPCSGEKKLFDR